MAKVAVVGGAPSSRLLAPYSDKNWTIWACSPANQGKLPRIDAWFELHPLDQIKRDWATEKPFFDWVNRESFDVWMQEENDIVPRAKKFPAQQLLDKYARFAFTSSVSWMTALALNTFENDNLTLGFWGVDMAANDEYTAQRSGLHYFCDLAERNGVNLVAPLASDLLTPPVLYGYSSAKHMATKLDARAKELRERIEACQRAELSAHDERVFLQGALDDCEYMRRTWTGGGDVK